MRRLSKKKFKFFLNLKKLLECNNYEFFNF